MRGHSTHERGVEGPLREVRVDWWVRLRSTGHRLTPQRELVLDAVTALRHATPEQVHEHVLVADPHLSISTVYRTLELLEELGLVRHAHFDHGAPSYHRAGHEHLHLVCHDCGAITSVDLGVAADFAARLRAVTGFDTDLDHFAVHGRCRDCGGQRKDQRAAYGLL